MAGHFHPANWNELLNWQDFIHHLLPHLNYREAVSLMLALGERYDLARGEFTRLPRSGFVTCRLNCESGAPPNRDQNLPPVVGHIPVGFNPVNTMRKTLHPLVTAGPTLCGNRAVFFNASSGRDEPSLCVHAGVHAHPPPQGRVPVCVTCKENRYEDFFWQLQELKFGVCHFCRDWALRNLRVNEDRCMCLPNDFHRNDVNNNEDERMHLCRDHYINYWFEISNQADAEMQYRDLCLRTRPKKKGHGWTKPKKGVVKVRTPEQRRRATKAGPLPPLGGMPYQPGMPINCYCGNPITMAEHNWGAGPNHIRNCVGCQKFMRME